MKENNSRMSAPLEFLPSLVRGLISLVILSLNTILIAVEIFPLAVVKLLLPVTSVRKRVDRLLHKTMEGWITRNFVWMKLTRTVEWTVEGVEQLRVDGWYLVVANHQSWADVFVLQKVLHGRIPPLKFPLKRELIWVPFAGFAWWALDFPFMSRHSEEFLAEHPERRGEDLAAIRRSCEKFRLVPTTLANFVEGTRFTLEKHDAQDSEYRHLLRPRAGGLALALDSMGEQFEALIDVTIFYPGGAPTFFEFLAGETERVVVVVKERPIPPDVIGGDYANDEKSRAEVQGWVNQLWSEKDQTLQSLHQKWDGDEV